MQSVASLPRRRAGAFKKFINRNMHGWLTALPLVIGIGVFTLYPMILSMVYSFNIVRTNGTMTFVGFANYKQMFGLDSDEFVKVLSNTFFYAVIAVPLNLSLSYFLALLVSREKKGVTFFRLLYYLPVVIPAIISGVIWQDMFNPAAFGFFNNILAKFGIPPQQFFTAPDFRAILSAIFMNVWGIGGGMILWLAALKNIPKSMYEAAKIDGAGAFKRFTHVTVPLSTPMIFYNLVTGIIGAMQMNSTMVFASGGGRGEQNALYFIAVKIYNEAFVNRSYGYAAALSWVLFAIIAVLTAITFKSNKWVYTGD